VAHPTPSLLLPRPINMFARAARSVGRVTRSQARLFSAASAAPAKSWAVQGTVLAVASGLVVADQLGAFSENKAAQCEAPFPYTGVPGTVNERSFIACKPDAVQRGLVGTIIATFEKKGYKLVALKMIWPSEEMAGEHYADLSKKPFFPALCKYFASGPIVAMVWEGPDVILTGRKMLGATNPNAAAPGTIRGDNCISVGRNICHGSDGPDSAKHEIGFWFTEKEVNKSPLEAASG
ncbi:unnamed protein product, partial [Chrysoparadoxa australica]